MPENELGQPIGFSVEAWSPPPWPSREPMVGRYCRLEALEPARHGADLHRANLRDREGRNWTYLPYGPFADLDAYLDWLNGQCCGDDPLFHVVIDNRSGLAGGLASYLRINPGSGSIEVGHINFAIALQRTRAATESMYLMMKRAFELGYRRYEWKCDALNARSRAAAQRLGMSYEGVFRQATVYKGRNRDTAWYALIDGEWAEVEAAFLKWLDPANFDADGKQRLRLGDLTAPLLQRRG
jgi:RimJ/RimL family protein N-acetyltransferase